MLFRRHAYRAGQLANEALTIDQKVTATGQVLWDMAAGIIILSLMKVAYPHLIYWGALLIHAFFYAGEKWTDKPRTYALLAIWAFGGWIIFHMVKDVIALISLWFGGMKRPQTPPQERTSAETWDSGFEKPPGKGRE